MKVFALLVLTIAVAYTASSPSENEHDVSTPGESASAHDEISHTSELDTQSQRVSSSLRQRPVSRHTDPSSLQDEATAHSAQALEKAYEKLAKTRNDALASANTHANLATKYAAEAISAPAVMAGSYLSGIPGAPGRAMQYLKDGRYINAVDQVTGLCWRLAGLIPLSAIATAVHGYKAIEQFCQCATQKSRAASLDESCHFYRDAIEGARQGDLHLLAAFNNRYGNIVRAIEHYEVRNPLRMARFVETDRSGSRIVPNEDVDETRQPFPFLHARRHHRSLYFSVAVDERRPLMEQGASANAKTLLHHQNAKAAENLAGPSQQVDSASTSRQAEDGADLHDASTSHAETHDHASASRVEEEAHASPKHVGAHNDASSDDDDARHTSDSDSGSESPVTSSSETSETDSDDSTPSRVAHVLQGSDRILVDVVRLPEQQRKHREARKNARKTWRHYHDTTKLAASLLRGATYPDEVRAGWHPDHDPMIQQWTEMPHLLVKNMKHAASTSRRGRTTAYSSGDDSGHDD